MVLDSSKAGPLAKRRIRLKKKTYHIYSLRGAPLRSPRRPKNASYIRGVRAESTIYAGADSAICESQSEIQTYQQPPGRLLVHNCRQLALGLVLDSDCDSDGIPLVRGGQEASDDGARRSEGEESVKTSESVGSGRCSALLGGHGVVKVIDLGPV